MTTIKCSSCRGNKPVELFQQDAEGNYYGSCKTCRDRNKKYDKHFRQKDVGHKPKFSISNVLEEFCARHARLPMTSYNTKSRINERDRIITGHVYSRVEYECHDEMVLSTSVLVSTRTKPRFGHPTGVAYGR